MSDTTFWLLLAGVLVIAELTSGTFYLLLLAVGALLGALSAYLQVPLSVQIAVAGVFCRRGLPLLQRYQEGDTKLELRFQVQGFDRVLIVCRDLGAGATANDSGLYPESSGQNSSAMLPHRAGFEKSLRMALDMAALREDTVVSR
ncbi:MAG: hypothetical protein HC848_07560, partial [Limnobacter sp.]|nr:hypothetical protein [Limnobacter sp.]